MDTRFVTIFKKPGNVFESPAAVCVLTDRDLQHLGTNSIPQTLRAIPGMQVAQHNAGSWAITLRGFSGLSRGVNGQFANKLLVLKDGRSIYTPLFSGVSWEAQDVLLEDVERIEIIRGPGAALWGANSVNGIINIISKSAQNTQGGLITLGGGTEHRAFGHLRYGGQLGNTTYYRVYGKYLKVDDLVDYKGRNAHDGWNTQRVGFRLDSHLTDKDDLTVQGAMFDGDFGQRFSDQFATLFGVENSYRSNMNGGHLLGKWQHRCSAFSAFDLQFYFDRVDINDRQVQGTIDAFDIDFQHRFHAERRHDILWGAEFRLTSDRFDSTQWFSLSPASRNVKLFSGFIQDEISLLHNRLRLTLGTKFEHNDYTGFEIQPNARLLWMPHEWWALWGTVARAVRTPSRSEANGRLVLGKSVADTVTQSDILFGSGQFKSEVLVSGEIGARFKTSEELRLDLSIFYNSYDDLRGVDDQPPILNRGNNGLEIITPLVIRNLARAHTYGIELTGSCYPFENWGLIASYSNLNMDVDIVREFEIHDQITEDTERQSPQHQFYLYSSLNLTRELSLDTSIRYVGALPAQEVDAYVTGDAQVLWNINRNFRLAVIGQNLLQKHHAESSKLLSSEQKSTASTVTLPSEVQRGVYSKLTYQF